MKRAWHGFVGLMVVMGATAACGDSDETSASGGSAMGGNDGGGSVMGGNGGGSSASGGGGAGSGGMAGTNDCQMLCDQVAAGGCADDQCLAGCEALVAAANANNCDGELGAYFDCLFALTDICNPVSCADVTTTVVMCAQGN